MPEQSAPPRIVQNDTLEMTTTNIGYTVVSGQPFVYKGVVGRKHFNQASTLVKDVLKEEFRFTSEPLAQGFTEIRKQIFVGLDRCEVPEAEPLTREIRHEGR